MLLPTLGLSNNLKFALAGDSGVIPALISI